MTPAAIDAEVLPGRRGVQLRIALGDDRSPQQVARPDDGGEDLADPPTPAIARDRCRLAGLAATVTVW